MDGGISPEEHVAVAASRGDSQEEDSEDGNGELNTMNTTLYTNFGRTPESYHELHPMQVRDADLCLILALRWLKSDEEELIRLVADFGPSSWETKAETLVSHRLAFEHEVGTQIELPAHKEGLMVLFTAESVAQRWIELAPRVKKELADLERKRACGHSCDSCPTRSSCKLHDAVRDIVEDW